MREMKDSGVVWIGEIPKNKQLISNKYFLDYTKGKLPSNTNLDAIGFPYIGASDLDSNIPYKTYTLDEELPEADENDLLVLWDGARAGLCGTHKKGKISTTIVRVRVNDQSMIYQPFIYWYYKGFEYYMYQRVSGTTIPHMNRKYIEEIQLIDWDYNEQKCIAYYLNSKCAKIDAIIKREQAVIEKLREYKMSAINEEIVEVEGQHCHLGYIATMKNGLNFSGNTSNRTIKFLGVGDFKDYFVLDKEDMFSDIIIDEDIAEDYLLKSGDIVFVRSNGSKELVGRSIMVENIDFPLTYSGFCIRFRNNRTDCLDDKYLLYFFRSPYFRKQLEKYSQGSNISNINQDLLSNISITIPSMEVQLKAVEKITSLCGKVDDVISKKQSVIDKLIEYKKSLIYEVVTGKKDIVELDQAEDNNDNRIMALLICRFIDGFNSELKGRVELQKCLFLFEKMVSLKINTQYIRQKHGPYDKKIEMYEKIAVDKHWINVEQGKSVRYHHAENFSSYRRDYDALLGDYDEIAKKIINFVKPMKRTSQVEKVATLMAVWNDFIIEGVNPTEEQLINEVRTNWTPNKAHSEFSTYKVILDKMKLAEFIPKGNGKSTVKM